MVATATTQLKRPYQLGDLSKRDVVMLAVHDYPRSAMYMGIERNSVFDVDTAQFLTRASIHGTMFVNQLFINTKDLVFEDEIVKLIESMPAEYFASILWCGDIKPADELRKLCPPSSQSMLEFWLSEKQKYEESDRI